ncbi:MAG: DNA polymerase III subunit delta [Bacteroidetes bacterium]|nr:DNA polymerase III subunit delta [Bacteroidota bacterium]
MLFSKIAGHKETKRKLIQTVLDQRVSHAQLFFGKEGAETLALAIAYAQFINCTNKQLPASGDLSGADACGTCLSCIKYQKLIHPDLHFILPVATTKRVTKKPKSTDFMEDWRKFLLENNYRVTLHEWYEYIGIENKQGIINVEDCHEIITSLSYKSYESEYKVMILWMVEKLFYAAAPKLLKILEEPPEKTLFILIAADPDQIISTILSRTQMVKIPGITPQELRDFLQRQFNLSEKDAEKLARQSNGDVKQALKIYQHSEEEQENFIIFRDWMRACINKDFIAMMSFSAEIAKIGRENQKSLLRYGLNIVQACGIYPFQPDKVNPSTGQEAEFIMNISLFIHTGNLSGFYDIFNMALFHIERNAYAQALFLDVSLNVRRLLLTTPKRKVS